VSRRGGALVAVAIPASYSQAVLSVWPENFGAEGDGVVDDTEAIRSAYEAVQSGGNLVLSSPRYLVSGPLALVDGKGVVAILGSTLVRANTWTVGRAFITGSGITGVKVSGIGIDGRGAWSSTPFQNPYSSGESVGFSNDFVGVSLSACPSASVISCSITGVGQAVVASYSDSLKVDRGAFTNLGQCAVTASHCKDLRVSGTTISGIRGQLTSAGDTDPDHSCYADAIFLYSVTGAAIVDNPLIEDVVRIGVVLESDGSTKNTSIVIRHNYIRNLHSSRNGQTNAAVWCEPGHSSGTVIDDNVFDNTGAEIGGDTSTRARGINAYDGCVCTRNVILGFTGHAGITGMNFDAIENTCAGNAYGISHAGGTDRYQSTIDRNQLIGNSLPGLYFLQAHGRVVVSNNLFRDNGQRTSVGYSKLFNSGVTIDRSYSDQTIVWSGANRFESSVSEGDVAGQLCGIYAKAGGTTIFDKSTVSGCVFVFSGHFNTSYPGKMALQPCSFASISVLDVVTVDEILNTNGNANGKIP
jgi:hypothetical protein